MLSPTALLPVLLALTAADRHELSSPDGKTVVVVHVDGGLSFSASRKGVPLVAPSPVSISVNGRKLGGGAIRNVARAQADRHIDAVFYPRRTRVRDHHRQLTLETTDGMGFTVRAYDDGVAYRLSTDLDGEITIDGESARFAFPGTPTVWAPVADCSKSAEKKLDCFNTSFEEPYTVKPLTALSAREQAFLPVLVDLGGNRPKLLLTEADLDDYPGLWLRGTSGPALEGVFAAYPVEEITVGGKYPVAAVARRAPYIARTQGRRVYPWRVLAIAERDTDLPTHDIVHRLGGEIAPGDWSWLKPGKSQSEWLWDNILYDVDFESGLNTATYRFYADFAARFKLGYLFFDAGWSSITDPLRVTPGLDMNALIKYAREQGQGVVLWTSAVALKTNLDAILDRMATWQASGVMVDFMDRDDQPVVRFYRRVVEAAAKRRLFVNFHGAYKPTGLERRFPNAVTREALMAFEYNKWSEDVTPEYEVTLPFIRGVVGPMDYEPGQMRNAQKDAFRVVGNQPMSQGTRMHQAAMYLVYESPYTKLGGNVSDYLREPEFTAFLAGIPTLWQDSRVLDGRVGDYVVVLRKAYDGAWWLGAMTDGSARTLTVPLSFLTGGQHRAEIHQDGPNAARYGADWRRSEIVLEPRGKLTIKMAPGGGFVARIVSGRGAAAK